MPTATYDVRANLLVQARNSHGEIRKLSQEVKGLGESLKTVQSSTRAAITQMVAFGAAFMGVRAISGAFIGLTKSAIGFSAELEKTKIGLQTVLMAVENTDWETAGKRAGAAFEKIREMAIKSPATSAEMFQIFNGIVGPVEAAGFAMTKVLDLTNDTTLAASALGVDFAQATRDVNMMVRGTAGAEVKLFSMLRSTGAIKEDAEAWNDLAPEKRVNLMSDALKKFAKGGAAFGSSWAGVTSTLQDIFDNLKASAFNPIMKRVAANIERFNTYILANRMAIELFLMNVGRGLANRIETVFIAAQTGFQYLVENWDKITAKFHEVVRMAKEAAPMIVKAAIAWEAVNISRNVLGGALSGGASLAGLVTGAGETGLGALLGLGKAGAAAAPGAAAAGSAARLGGTFGMMGAGSGAAGGGNALAGLFGMMGGGAGAAGGGGAAASGGVMASLAALGPLLLIVGAALAALLAIGLAFKEQWQNMVTIFGATGGQTIQMLVEFGQALWKFLAPIFKVLGHLLLMVLVPAWQVFTILLRGFLFAMTAVFEVLGSITNAVYNSLKPAFDFVFDLFRQAAAFFNDVFGEATKPEPTEEGPSYDPNQDYSRWLNQAPLSSSNMDLSKAAKGATNISLSQDFRGSRISVKQEFKGDQDPDRIVMAMMTDLTRQAENRVSSGYAGALTR